MIGEIKYCKFCNKSKPIKEFVKSGFAIKNICRECQNKKQAQIYRDSKRIKKLEQENQELKKQLEVGKEQYNDLVEEKEKIQEQLSSNTLQFENQQKEFIEWLEEKIPRSSCIGEDGFGRIQYESKDIYYEINKILLKYKEIVGGKEWDKD